MQRRVQEDSRMFFDSATVLSTPHTEHFRRVNVLAFSSALRSIDSSLGRRRHSSSPMQCCSHGQSRFQ